MFEYFLFCFFYFLTSNPKITFKTQDTTYAKSGDKLGVSSNKIWLLEPVQIQGFFSKMAPIRPEASRQTKKKPAITYLLSKYLNFFFPLDGTTSQQRSNTVYDMTDKTDIIGTFLIISSDYIFNQLIDDGMNRVIVSN